MPTIAATDITPAAVPTEPGGAVIGSASMTISKARRRSSGKAGAGVAGDNYDTVVRINLRQAFRTLVNEVEPTCSWYKTRRFARVWLSRLHAFRFGGRADRCRRDPQDFGR
jgi:hypothetical protein